MCRKALCLLLLTLLVAPVPPLSAQASADPDVTKGIGLVDEGDFDGAILTLDNAARRLSADKSKFKDLSQAYLYLGIAYMGKGHEAAARAKFREAFAQIKDLTLSPDKFPPKVIDAFEAAKEEARKDAVGTARAGSPGSASGASGSAGATEKKKGGGGKALLVVGGIAALGAGVAVAAGGGGGGSSTPAPTTTTQPPDPRKTETFTGTLCGNSDICSNEAGFDIVVSAAGMLEATVTWNSSDTNIFFDMALDDENFVTVSRSNRTSNTTSQLSAAVTPQTSSPSAAYHLFVGRGDNLGALDFTVTVKHP